MIDGIDRTGRHNERLQAAPDAGRSLRGRPQARAPETPTVSRTIGAPS